MNWNDVDEIKELGLEQQNINPTNDFLKNNGFSFIL